MTERLTWEPPDRMDGEPIEVADRILDQLDGATEVVQTLVTHIALVRSAALTVLLDRDPELTPQELAEALDGTDLDDRLRRLRSAVTLLGRAKDAVREGFEAV